MNWKLFSKCELNTCRKWRFLIRKCTVKLPNGQEATLQKKLMCGSCITKVRAKLEKYGNV